MESANQARILTHISDDCSLIRARCALVLPKSACTGFGLTGKRESASSYKGSTLAMGTIVLSFLMAISISSVTLIVVSLEGDAEIWAATALRKMLTAETRSHCSIAAVGTAIRWGRG